MPRQRPNPGISGSAKQQRETANLSFVYLDKDWKIDHGRSIAEAMGRKFTLLCCGLDDETVIKGVHRSYQAQTCRSLRREAGVKNPVIMIDEIDKLGISRQGSSCSLTGSAILN